MLPSFTATFSTQRPLAGVCSVIKLNEDDSTSSSWIFIKIQFQELAEFIGLASGQAGREDYGAAQYMLKRVSGGQKA